MILDADMKTIIRDCDWIAIATCKGKACQLTTLHMIAVWEAVILDNDTLGMYAGGMFKTAENLKSNPKAQLLITSKKHKKGYRFMGTAEIIPKSALDEKITEKMFNANKDFFNIAHSMLLVKVDKAFKLI